MTETIHRSMLLLCTGFLFSACSKTMTPPPSTLDFATISNACVNLLHETKLNTQHVPQAGAILYGASETNGTNVIVNLYYDEKTFNGLNLVFRFKTETPSARAETILAQALPTILEDGTALFTTLQAAAILPGTQLRHIETPDFGLSLSYVYGANSNLLTAISLDLITSEHQQTMLDRHFKKP